MIPPDSGRSDDLAVTVTVDGASARVTAAGQIHGMSVPHLAAALETAAHGTVRSVTVDLNEVSFIDSDGLELLALAHRDASALGTRLRVVASSRAVLRPLEVSGLWALVGPSADAAQDRD